MIDLNTNEVIEQLKLEGVGPYGGAIDAERNLLYVSGFTNNSVLALNMNTLEVMSSVSLGEGQGPQHMALTPDGRLMYVVNNSGNTLSALIR